MLDDPNEVGEDQLRQNESLLQTIKEDEYHKVEGQLTAKALLDSGGNPLILALEVRCDIKSLYIGHIYLIQ